MTAGAGIDLSSSMVSPIQNVPGAALTHASRPDSILVVLQNAKVKSVVEPGRRVGRFFRGPMVGHFQVIEINTGWVQVKRTITNVRSGEKNSTPFHAPRLTVTMRAHIAPDYGYRDLKCLIADAGLDLGHALIAAMTSGIERSLRDTFASRSHDEWYSAALTEAFAKSFPINDTFGPPDYDELLRVRSLEEVSVEWDEHFLRMRQAEMDVAITASLQAAAKAEQSVINARELEAATGRLERVSVDAEADNLAAIAAAHTENSIAALAATERLKLMHALQRSAAELGVPVEAITDPEGYKQTLAQQHELRLRLTDPGAQGLLHRNPELMQVFGPYTHPAPAPAQPVAATAARVPPSQLPPRGADGSGGIDIELTQNARLRRVWRSVRPSDDVVGIASSEQGQTAVVVAVVKGALAPRSEVERIEARFADYLSVARVKCYCVSLVGGNEELLTRLVHSVAPTKATHVAVRSTLTATDRLDQTLTLVLSSATDAAGEVRDQLLSPEPPVLAAISELLTYDEIRVEVEYA